MSVLVLAIEKPYWQDVMSEVAKSGVPITHAVVHYRDAGGPNHFFEQYDIKQIPGKPFYRVEDISKQLLKDFGTGYPPLDAKTINGFAAAERDFYNLTDRFNYFPKSFRYRKRLFRESIRYWLAFFAANKITALYLGCTPHNLADYTCFHTAKYLGIPTVLVGHTMINDHVIIRHDYRENVKVPDSFMPGATFEQLKNSLPEFLYSSAFSDSKVLQYVVQKNDASAGAKNIKPAKKEIDLKIAKKQLKRYLFKAPKFKAALAMNGVYPPIFRRSIKAMNKAGYKLRQNQHNRLAVTPDLDAKYIYFAMHLQPERTSTPEAELFEDHLLAIDILAKALPEGWQLYVKENPRQFDKINFIKGWHQRDKSDYDDFLKNPKIKLISQKIPSKDIIKNAQIVSTLSGSVGWEALRAGKPVIIFANAWYSACESATRVENVEQAKQAIASAASSTPQNIELNILRYLSYMQNVLNIGNMGTNTYLKASKLPYQEIVSKMAERIVAELKNFS